MSTDSSGHSGHNVINIIKFRKQTLTFDFKEERLAGAFAERITRDTSVVTSSFLFDLLQNERMVDRQNALRLVEGERLLFECPLNLLDRWIRFDGAWWMAEGMNRNGLVSLLPQGSHEIKF